MTRPEVTPAALGYRWPAEWEPHAATWLAWPHNRNTWPGKFAPVPTQFAAFVRTLAEFEPVHILAGGESVAAEARALIGDVPDVRLWDIETNDAWCRDHGPIFLVGPPGAPPALVDWEYNSWGGKYPPFDQDNRVPAEIAGRLQSKAFRPGIVLEGGAIEGNGRGTLLSTESCLLNPNRNPGLSRQGLEQILHDYLGVSNILWLSRSELAGDDTDGRIDQLARFVSSNTLVAIEETDPADVNFAPLRQNLRQLQSMRDEEGRPLRVVSLPLPHPKFCKGQRLPASYANFYIANGVVVVPQFDDPADAIAVDTLQDLFPDREVRGLPALDLVWGLGAFHCLSQQQPAAS